VAFSPDGKLVVSGSDDNTVRLWDAATGAARQTLQGHSESVRSVTFSPNGKLMVSGSDDNIVRLWDAATGVARQMLEGHSGWVSSVAFSPDGKLVVSGSDDNIVRFWDAATGAARQTLEGHWSWAISVAFSPDGKAHGLFVSNEWIAEGGTNILWLPPDYRATSTAVWNSSVALGHSSGTMSYLKFDEGLKVI
jgi:WD40 repeat protein